MMLFPPRFEVCIKKSSYWIKFRRNRNFTKLGERLLYAGINFCIESPVRIIGSPHAGIIPPLIGPTKKYYSIDITCFLVYYKHLADVILSYLPLPYLHNP